jgi:hypothetical protein
MPSARQIRSIILLGGAVRGTEFAATIQRSILDLPLGGGGGGRGGSLLQHWGTEISALSRSLGMDAIPTRLVIGPNCPFPQSRTESPGVHLTIERDPVEFRGTGGVLRDLAQDYADDDLLLVANSNYLAAEPLTDRAERLLSAAGDVRLLAGPNQSPGGMMLLRCGVLREIAVSGFVDFKEQALPAIGRRHAVRVVAGGDSPCFSIRGWDDYLAALRSHHRPTKRHDSSPYQETWQPRFRIVEEPADVDGTAVVHDSVILRGGRVEPGATVVRSLVGPTGFVRRGSTAIGRLIQGNT